MITDIQHIQQPTPYTCVHACLAMVTGKPVEYFIERFGDHGLSWHEETVALVEHKIFPEPFTHMCDDRFPIVGNYFITTASLNLVGSTHRVLLSVTPDDHHLYDPNEGKDGKEWYNTRDVNSGKMRIMEVTYLNPTPLRSMIPMETMIEMLLRSNSLLRTSYSIAQRKGENVNWEGYNKKLKILLDDQHEFMKRYSDLSSPKIIEY